MIAEWAETIGVLVILALVFRIGGRVRQLQDLTREVREHRRASALDHQRLTVALAETETRLREEWARRCGDCIARAIAREAARGGGET